VLSAEDLNLFGLDQGQILTRVGPLSKVPVSQDPHFTLNGDALTLYLSGTALRADEDAFNDHGALLTACRTK
jgi:hypothetical protein